VPCGALLPRKGSSPRQGCPHQHAELGAILEPLNPESLVAELPLKRLVHAVLPLAAVVSRRFGTASFGLVLGMVGLL